MGDAVANASRFEYLSRRHLASEGGTTPSDRAKPRDDRVLDAAQKAAAAAVERLVAERASKTDE